MSGADTRLVNVLAYCANADALSPPANEPPDSRVVAALDQMWRQSSPVERAQLLMAFQLLALRWLRRAL